MARLILLFIAVFFTACANVGEVSELTAIPTGESIVLADGLSATLQPHSRGYAIFIHDVDDKYDEFVNPFQGGFHVFVPSLGTTYFITPPRNNQSASLKVTKAANR